MACAVTSIAVDDYIRGILELRNYPLSDCNELDGDTMQAPLSCSTLLP